MNEQDWDKILYLHALRIVKALTADDLERETRAGEAIAKLARAAGVT